MHSGPQPLLHGIADLTLELPDWCMHLEQFSTQDDVTQAAR